MPQDAAREAETLVVLFDHESDFGGTPVGNVLHDITPPGDDRLVVPSARRDYQGDLPRGIRLRGPCQLCFGRFRDVPKESGIHRLTLEAAERLGEAIPIVRADVTDRYGRAVSERQGDAQIARVGHVPSLSRPTQPSTTSALQERPKWRPPRCRWPGPDRPSPHA